MEWATYTIYTGHIISSKYTPCIIAVYPAVYPMYTPCIPSHCLALPLVQRPCIPFIPPCMPPHSPPSQYLGGGLPYCCISLQHLHPSVNPWASRRARLIWNRRGITGGGMAGASASAPGTSRKTTPGPRAGCVVHGVHDTCSSTSTFHCSEGGRLWRCRLVTNRPLASARKLSVDIWL